MGPVFEKADGIRGFQIASPSLIGLRCIKTSFEIIKGITFRPMPLI
jgi:kynureninase